MKPESGFAPVDGTSLYYEVTGDGPALALLHGRGADHRMWPDQVPAFARRYRVVNYDLRGFGQSPPGENRYTHADDLARLLDHLGIDRVVPIGLSLGGGAAVNFAVLHPDRTRALVTVDSSLGGFAWSKEFSGMMEGIARAARESGVEAAKALYGSWPIFARLYERPGAQALVGRILRDDPGWHMRGEDRGRPLDPPAIARLGTIRVPTLVIVGALDLPDFLAIAETLETGIPNARRVVLDGIGHVPNLEAPERFNDLVLGFLDQVHAAAPA